MPRDQVKSWTAYPGGAPANVATALSKLGVPTAFVSAIGNDDRGEGLMTLLAGGCNLDFTSRTLLGVDRALKEPELLMGDCANTHPHARTQAATSGDCGVS